MPFWTTHRYSNPKLNATLRDAKGTVVDLTGGTLKVIMKRDIEDADANAVFDITATLTSAVDGEYRIQPTRSQMSIPPAALVGQVRFWDTGVATTEAPNRTEDASITHLEAVRQAEV